MMSKPQPAAGNFPRPADEMEGPDPGEAIATPREKPAPGDDPGAGGQRVLRQYGFRPNVGFTRRRIRSGPGSLLNL
jgi:hypothetical protein